MIDTGAPTTAVTQQLAERLQLKAEQPAPGVGASGATTARSATIPRIAIGASSVEDMRVAIVDFAMLEAKVANADGVLGLDFLGHFTVRLDATHAQLLLLPPGTIATDRGVRFERARLLFIDAELEGRTAPFALDTGAGRTIVSPSLVPSHTLSEADPLRAIGGSGSLSTVSSTNLDSLKVGSYVRTGLEVRVADIFAPLIAATGHDMQGLIGADFFEHDVLTIDFGTQRLTLE